MTSPARRRFADADQGHKVNMSAAERRADAVVSYARDLRRESRLLCEQSAELRTFARQILVDFRATLDSQSHGNTRPRGSRPHVGAERHSSAIFDGS